MIFNEARSASAGSTVWWELRCPSEERISAAHTPKTGLISECNAWSCHNMAIEGGATGVVDDSPIKTAAVIEMRD